MIFFCVIANVHGLLLGWLAPAAMDINFLNPGGFPTAQSYQYH